MLAIPCTRVLGLGGSPRFLQTIVKEDFCQRRGKAKAEHGKDTSKDKPKQTKLYVCFRSRGFSASPADFTVNDFCQRHGKVKSEHGKDIRAYMTECGGNLTERDVGDSVYKEHT